MASSNQIRITFLLGSGISIAVKMPSIKEITERILSGKNIHRADNGTYYLGEATNGFNNEYIDKAVKFLKRIKIEADNYYKNDREINYEDLYYIATQIYDSENREYDNPVVQSFIEKIISDITPLFPGKEGEHRDEWTLEEISQEAINYVKDIVWRILISKKPENVDRLKGFKNACLDEDVSSVDIFTLNHDTVLEDYLSKANVKLIDGFGNPENEVRYWDPYLFVSKSAKVKFFKLHGSLNWFLFGSKKGNLVSERIGIPLNRSCWDTEDPNGQMQRPIYGRPEFLAGTFNKMFDYTSSIYAELHCQFYYALRNIEQIVIYGYGFGDKGINRRIFEWVYSSLKHRLIIIDLDSEKLKQKARGVLAKNWDDLENHNKLIFIPRGIENTSWQKIKENLFKEIK